MTSFANLKKQSGSFDRLLKEVEKQSSPATYDNSEEESKYWKPTFDKAGNALAVIRFLPEPAVDGDDALPWVRYWDHGFKGPTGKWYIERSLTTLNQKDPVAEYNSQLWNSSTDDNSPERVQAREQKRRLHYVSLIYVVSDPANPDAEGKTFYFKYGKKIHDKILKQMKPDLPTEPKVNPFDLWKGANFKLKVTRQNVKMGGRTVAMPNYDEAVFLAPGPLFEDDEAMEAVWKSSYSLLELIAPETFKTYDELKRKLDEVLGNTETPAPRTAPAKPDPVKQKIQESIQERETEETVPWDEEDADLKRFRELAMD